MDGSKSLLKETCVFAIHEGLAEIDTYGKSIYQRAFWTLLDSQRPFGAPIVHLDLPVSIWISQHPFEIPSVHLKFPASIWSSKRPFLTPIMHLEGGVVSAMHIDDPARSAGR